MSVLPPEHRINPEMAALVRAFDWSLTPLGPIDRWPAAMRAAVDTLLASPFPMALLWGPELILIYNDAYRVIAADKHPYALGRSTREVWSEVWHINEPIFGAVMSRGASFFFEDMLFPIRRGPESEDAYFTLSYSPVFLVDGTVGGTLVVLLETTQRIRAEIETKHTLESLADGFFAVDTNWRILYANAATSNLLAVAEREFTGLSLWDVLAADMASVLRPYFDRAARGERLQVEAHDSARGRWFHYRFFPRPGGGVTVYFKDITERIRADEALRQNRALLAAFVQSTPDVVWAKDLNGRFLLFNEAAAKSSGIAAERALGADFRTFFSPAEVEALEAYDHAVLANGEPVTYESTVATPNGQRTYLSTKGLVRDERGVVLGTFGSGRDITDFKRRNARALEESRAHLELALEATGAGNWEWDLKDQFRWSPQMRRMHGLPDGDEPITRETWLELLRPSERNEFRWHLESLAATGSELTTEVRVLGPDNRERWMTIWAHPVRDDDGRLLRYVGICLDVTLQRRKEHEQQEFERQLLHAQKLESLGVLAGGIAHDFNNLLTGIIGNVELALLECGAHPPSSIVHNLQCIRATGIRLSDLTRQMLAYSGKGKFKIEQFDLSTLVKEIVNLLEVALPKKVLLTLELQDDLAPIEGDGSQIRQVVMNLITNAAEAIGAKSGIVAIRTGAVFADRDYFRKMQIEATQLPEGYYVFVEVSDTGCGMTRDVQAKIFDPFFTTKFTGRGLGLAAVLGIVNGHGGAIKVYSEPNKGTTFKVLFPYAKKEDAKPKVQSTSADWHGGRGRAVLLVDDEETVRAVMRAMLERMGFTVVTADDGLEAVQRFAEQPLKFDLVLLDLTMPKKDGIQTFSELRRLREGVPIILCSGYNEQEAVAFFAGKGLAGFPQKPIGYEPLVERLRAVLS